MTKRGVFSMAASLVVVTLLGCGRNDLVPVEGVVTLDDEVVPGATVLFMPQGDPGRPASGYTDEEGVFRLTTFKPGDGALRGEYRVLVTKSKALEAPPSFEPGDEEKIMAHYKAMKAQRRKKEQVPEIYGDGTKTPLSCTVPAGDKVRLELRSDPKK
jgi:hypothetical protein